MPTTIAVPPGRSTSHASRIVAGWPTASSAWSTPPRTSARTAARGSPSEASTVSVAPRVRASASFAGSRSTATIRPAPAIRTAGADRPRAAHTPRGDDLLADPAAADDAYALADPHPRGVAHRAEAGDDGAAEQRRLPEGQLRCDPDGARGGDDAALREA